MILDILVQLWLFFIVATVAYGVGSTNGWEAGWEACQRKCDEENARYREFIRKVREDKGDAK